VIPPLLGGGIDMIFKSLYLKVNAVLHLALYCPRSSIVIIPPYFEGTVLVFLQFPFIKFITSILAMRFKVAARAGYFIVSFSL
jgi:hypothetical protein